MRGYSDLVGVYVLSAGRLYGSLHILKGPNFYESKNSRMGISVVL